MSEVVHTANFSLFKFYVEMMSRNKYVVTLLKKLIDVLLCTPLNVKK
jgi:hypothetical protein